MPSFIDSLHAFLKQSWCDALSTANFLYDTTGMLSYDPLQIRSKFGLAYRMYCDKEPPAQPAPPFTGGQCAGKSYIVSWFWHSKNLFGNPFNYDSSTPPLPGGIGQILSIADTNAPGGYTIQIPYNIGNGDTKYYVAASTGNSQAPFSGISYGITNVRTADNSPDTCGDPPPPDIVPPSVTDRSFPFNFTYIDSGNNTINVNATAVFAPLIISGNGIVYAPIRFNFNFNPNLKIDGLLRLDIGDLQINFGDANKLIPRDPGAKDQPTLPPNVPDFPPNVPGNRPYRNPDKPSADTERIMLGALVTVTKYSSPQGVIYQDTNPDIALPRFGNISFLCSVGGHFGWTTDIPVRCERQFIQCPWDGGATQIAGTPSLGVEWTILPVYAERTPTIKFE